MLIYSNTLTRADLERICENMGIQLYGCWDDFYGPRRRRFDTCIRPLHGERGEQWRKVRVDQFTGRKRRIFACSWDAHYVFMSALLELDPNAEIKSCLAHWKGQDDFHERALDTGGINWGSQMYPQYAAQMCHEPMGLGAMQVAAHIFVFTGLSRVKQAQITLKSERDLRQENWKVEVREEVAGARFLEDYEAG